MDRIEKRSRGRECVRIGDVKVSRLLFADDLVLLASSQEDLQRALDRFAAECEVDGMRINTSKTEVMVLSREPVDCTEHVSGVQLRQVEEFKYLGILFSSDGRMERELSRRINQASAVMRELRAMAGNAWLSMEAQVTIYNSLFKSVLTYGHESWILTERTRSRVQADEIAGASGRDALPAKDRRCLQDGSHQEHTNPGSHRSRAATPPSGEIPTQMARPPLPHATYPTGETSLWRCFRWTSSGWPTENKMGRPGGRSTEADGNEPQRC